MAINQGHTRNKQVDSSIPSSLPISVAQLIGHDIRPAPIYFMVKVNMKFHEIPSLVLEIAQPQNLSHIHIYTDRNFAKTAKLYSGKNRLPSSFLTNGNAKHQMIVLHFQYRSMQKLQVTVTIEFLCQI